jgi:hypothetical protein
MADSDFKAAILETEIVMAHEQEGHIYHFPILSNGIISLPGSRMEPNSASKREARRFLQEAYAAARTALARSADPVKS